VKLCAEVNKNSSYCVQPGRQFIFNTIEAVKEHATRWLWTDNNQRPNMAIGERWLGKSEQHG
jgi:hypothetical protein